MRVKGQVRWKGLNVEQIIRDIEGVETEVLQEAKAAIRSLLVRNLGTQYFTLRQLQLMKHPYSHTGSGRPGGLPAGVVNKQSGGFFEGVTLRGPFNTGRRISILVSVQPDKQALAGWLTEGTERMRGRPWAEHLRSEINRTVVPELRSQLGQKIRLTVKKYA